MCIYGLIIYLLSAFDIAKSITHPISLIAYLAAAVMTYFINRDLNKRKIIESVQKGSRGDVIIKTAEKLHLDINAVPLNERAKLISQVLRNRIYRLIIIAIITVILGVLISLVVLNTSDKNDSHSNKEVIKSN